MREFFRGWRRKAGCVTLVMACFTMVGWTRSRFVFDNIDVIVNDQTYVTALSCIHGIGWSKSHYRQLKLPATMQFVRYRTSEQPFGPIMVEVNNEEAKADDEETEVDDEETSAKQNQNPKPPHSSHRDVSRNLFVIYVDEVGSDPQSQTVIIRYFVIVLPLTLLSACLLLSKPRKPSSASLENLPND